MTIRQVTFRDANFPHRNVWCWSKVEGLHLRWVPFGMPKLSPFLSNSVFFLYEKDPAKAPDSEDYIGPCGTGVIVGVRDFPRTGMAITSYYAITAAHVARDGGSIIKLNTKAGPARALEFDPCEWIADLNWEDIAAVDITDRIKHDVDEVSYVSVDMLADRDFITSRFVEFGIGEDGFMLGLFSEHSGDKSNLVAARFGNVSMLVNDLSPIPRHVPGLDIDFESPCHVFDMHSRPGFSGSPVFVYRTPDGDLSDLPGRRTRKFKIPSKLLTQNISAYPNIEVEDLTEGIATFLKLFGVHVGQFHDEVTITKVLDGTEKNANPELKDGDTIRFPGSMTIIVPAWQILKLLEHPDLKKQRDERMAARAAADLADPKRGAVVSERVRASEAGRESGNPDHKEDFRRLLNAAARTQKQGD